jgi:hypothetical protein
VAEQRLVVTFDAAISAADARRVLDNAGVRIVENPDLVSTDWLVEGSEEAVARLAESDAIVRVIVASSELAQAVPVQGCPGAQVNEAQIAEYRAAVGTGWDGAGTGPAELTWSAERIHPSLDSAWVKDTFARALAAWSKHARLTFQYTSQTGAARSLDFVVLPAEHGDGFPFDGKGRTLAHAFFPAGTTPEPLAGDVHFDADETWTEGGSPDLYSAALHEIGHALGLSHSDQPGAVMYPYYRRLVELQPDDIAALRTLYGTEEALTMNVAPFPGATSGSAVELAGTVTGGSGDVSVTWSSGLTGGTADGGRAWRAAAVPLSTGDNVIALTARDASGATVSRSVTIRRGDGLTPSATPQAPSSGSADASRPSLAITSPAAASYATSASQLRISGTARDNVAVREITWQCGSFSGTASGTTSWNFTLPLLVGENNLIVRVRDEAGNVSWRTRTITRR